MTLAIRASAVDEPTTLPSEHEIRAQLDRIRSSPEFDTPERARKFLGYVIEEAIAGRSGRIKAYTIATEVFGRETSFDAQADPAVRIEAGRVRRALERYYLVAGREDPIIIAMPKGGYVPTFTRRMPAEANGHNAIDDAQRPLRPGWRWLALGIAASALVVFIVTMLPQLTELPAGHGNAPTKQNEAQPDIPRILVEPFEDLSNGQLSSTIARGLTEEVISQIVKFKEIAVVAGRASDLPTAKAFGSKPPLYALQGTVRVDSTKLRLSVRLVQRSDQSIIWASNYDEVLDVRNLLTVEAEVARAVATALAQPYGIIFRTDATNLTQSAPQDWEAYACTLAYYGYRADLDPQTHASVQTCLQKAVARFPNYATAWALLSLTYIDELRFRYRFDEASPVSLDRAVETAARAVELDPQNVRALQAEMLGFFFRGEIDTALKVGARAMAINPNDTELAGEYGFRLALSGHWPEGCKLVSGAVERNPGPLGYFETALAICSYISGDYRTAERWARLADMQTNPIYHLILLAILGRSGQAEEAAQELQWLRTNAPELVRNIRREVAMRVSRPIDQAKFIDGIRQAGLAVPEE
ncbi:MULTISPECIES: hypothetical protein [unclassified Ensifer]|uniref:hypothetical protein n=1 Tax=unclassified Ensifer TaxID=2633371 RepID=UPI0008131165|nr:MULTISPECIES: hypothetical protein [unclassified Ensifer]OCP16438.1 hypothetical protein BC361_10885 [Ensifer sp. LC54]OCP20370.1 hypothetical protein BC363_06010 [Ensifer sp. LC384]